MLIKCGTCKGKRHVVVEDLGIAISCDVCHGKGGFDVPDNKKLCPDCGGRRTMYVDIGIGIKVECGCPNCYATGFVDK